ncbi:hypothetical protein F4811DRAFT_44061 [Daldinia bambusicola]|nr:hypothetical protein F4811DRAFT_44061 [Daldinia bambusicola]
MASTFSSFATKMQNLGRSAVKRLLNRFGAWEKVFVAYISRRHVYSAITAWGVTFIALITYGFNLGFGPAGVMAGSFAAAFQSVMYGGFTPAGGLFAGLTSLAMLGAFAPALVGGAAALALIPGAIAFFLVED